MSKSRTSRRGGFLDQYNPAETYLLKPDRRRGAPGILEGSSSSGDPLLIRVWPRNEKADDQDLVEIWRNELRLLHRVGGAPGAEEFIARLLDAGEDKKGFYIVIAAAQRRPVSILLDRGRSGAGWLRVTSSIGNRRRLWANLSRVVSALEVLHSQGLIHCNLDTWAVLSSGDVEPDFQLTGFEWSMRLMHADKDSQRPTTSRGLSFLDDWKAFATLTATLLEIDLRRLNDFRIPHFEVASNVKAEEAWLLRELLSPSPMVQLDGDYINRRIALIIETLEDAASAEEPQYQLVLRLGRESGLSAAVREASDLTIDLDDVEAQLSYISADLAKPRVLAVGQPEDYSLLVRGTDLVYRLRKYSIAKQDNPTWEFALCERATLGKDFSAPFLANDQLPANSIRLMTFREASQRAPRTRGRVLSWENVRRRLEAATPKTQTREQKIFRALSLLYAVDLISTVAEVFPVRARLVERPGDTNLVEIVLKADQDRADLGDLVKLRTPEERLDQLLEREIGDDEGWRLGEARPLGRRDRGDVELQFEKVSSSHGNKTLLFRPLSPTAHIPTDGILIPGEHRGRITQFRRRANALQALLSHTELLRMLGDPRGGLTSSHETLKEDAQLDRLDSAKRDAFRELTAVIPLYLVQGPPGVGKTFLVREVVRRRFADESTARLLLTAQSHHAVDHLMTQIRKDWTDEQAPLAVRSRTSDKSESYGDLDLRPRSEALLNDLAGSELAKTCSRFLAERLQNLATAKDEKSRASERRLLEGLVMRAANIVFATTNSGDLERLLEEKGQFDWVIVEEAGKATGVELLIPLLLSYRRLMIGDHKQLPPYGSEKLDALLKEPANLRSAIKLGLEMIEPALREVIPEELLQIVEKDDGEEEFARLCTDAGNSLFLFQSMLETQIARQSTPGSKGHPIARTLNIQHRMHPDIAQLVSRCFYDTKIATDEKARKAFAEDTCPIEAKIPNLNTPITIIDMPYEAATKGVRNVERYPRYTNELEAKAVAKIVGSLRGISVDGKKPSLVVLSPYARQVTQLVTELADDPASSKALESFSSVARHGAWCSTVDAFQGNEADAVIVSLVRNNHHATPRQALGFVSDSRRMNVLLSRAKWRLYIVTSLDFLRTVTKPIGRDDKESAFLHEMLIALDEYMASGVAQRIDGRDLLGGTQ
ncbi:AAA domain-containing protein [Agrobacterium leguminum]|uniref:DEAD/DEAH box helicase n=1 Tax=Agrobacterium leguminum TaxID=2792015 RepID=UPI0030CB9F99